MNSIISFLKKYRGGIAVAMLLGTINQIFSLLGPQIFRIITDEYATNASSYTQKEFISGVGFWLLVGVGLALVSRIAKTFQDFKVSSVTERAGADLYEHAVEHSFRLPYSVFEDQRSGELLQKLQQARGDISRFVASFINVAFLAVIGIMFVLLYALTVHWSIAVAFFLLIPIMGVTTYVLSKKIEKQQKQVVTELTDLSGSTTETLRNVEIVKSLGLERQEIARLNASNQSILNLEIKKIKLFRTLTFTQGTIVNLSRTGVEFLLLFLVFTGTITLGEFFSMIIYSFFVFNPLYQLGNVAGEYREAKASSEFLQEVLDQPTEELSEDLSQIDDFQSLNLENVSFHYANLEKQALGNISITVDANKTLALVGPSGSGKTTLLKILIGLYHPTSGTMKVNGKNYREIDYNHLRHRIGYVSQDTQLFSGTIRDNLKFVYPEATDAECLSALEKAQAIRILDRGNEGLDTKIGEGGLKLSGGERQRLAIARALLRDPEMIIFDEATSSLDSITEKAITETIQHISQTEKNLTVLIVAHRLSTVTHADTIHVLEHGKLIESGNHDQLLKQDGLYKALWRMQAGS